MTLNIEKIERVGDEKTALFKIEGKLAGSSISELEIVYSGLTVEERGRLQLDLKWITFIDEKGQELLKRIIENGGRIVRSNLYVDNLMDLGQATPMDVSMVDSRHGISRMGEECKKGKRRNNQ